MPIDLYGDEYLTRRDYARKIVTKGAKLPFYRFGVKSKEKSVHIFYKGEDGQHLKQKFFETGGLYAIYQIKRNKVQCLYVGFTTVSVRYRLYRFAKELLGLSRDDEDHVGAQRARLDGVKPKNLYVKFMPLDDLPQEDIRENIMNIDETVAAMLNAKYNTRINQ